jgi:hypothetical protein
VIFYDAPQKLTGENSTLFQKAKRLPLKRDGLQLAPHFCEVGAGCLDGKPWRFPQRILQREIGENLQKIGSRIAAIADAPEPCFQRNDPLCGKPPVVEGPRGRPVVDVNGENPTREFL